MFRINRAAKISGLPRTNHFKVNSQNLMKQYSQMLPFITSELQNIQVISRDYPGSLIHLLNSFKDHKVNLTCIETRRLNHTNRGHKVMFSMTFDRIGQKQYQEFLGELRQKFDDVETTDDKEIPIVPWYPRQFSDLEKMGSQLMNVTDSINQDHPQFTDQEYRKRRDYIAQISQSHKLGQEVPIIGYTEQENQTWLKIYSRLKEVQKGVMSERFIKNLEKVDKALGLSYRLPEIRDIDLYLKAETGFRIKAAHGILNQRDFLNSLAHRVFSCTQYIRHHATPEYTPEPDIVHELVGHVAMFADKEVADLSQEIGLLSCGARSNQLARLGSIYWYTIEYGSHIENGQPRAYGAGIASSIGECQVNLNSLRQNYTTAKFEKLNPFIHADRKYPIQTYQDVYMYSESFEQSITDIQRFGENLSKPFKTYYDFKTNEVKSDKLIRGEVEDEEAKW